MTNNGIQKYQNFKKVYLGYWELDTKEIERRQKLHKKLAKLRNVDNLIEIQSQKYT